MKKGPKPRNPIDRFEEKYIVLDNGCWQWTGAFIEEGYGRFYLDGRVVQAHHAATALYRGVYAEGRHGCHTCDNRWCVNPEHIFYGTQQDNVDDMIAKGRFRSGDHSGVHNGRAVLTPELVQEIRKVYDEGGVTQKELALRYGVGTTQMNRIVRRLQWT